MNNVQKLAIWGSVGKYVIDSKNTLCVYVCVCLRAYDVSIWQQHKL